MTSQVVGNLGPSGVAAARVSVSTPPTSGPMALVPPSVAPKAPSARAKAAPENSAQQRCGGGEQHRAADSLQRAEQLQPQRGR
ncbi:MAG TPA: hypothetical protein VF349_05350, partial [Candidatus Limnocylindrales bacterium]